MNFSLSIFLSLFALSSAQGFYADCTGVTLSGLLDDHVTASCLTNSNSYISATIDLNGCIANNGGVLGVRLLPVSISYTLNHSDLYQWTKKYV